MGHTVCRGCTRRISIGLPTKAQRLFMRECCLINCACCFAEEAHHSTIFSALDGSHCAPSSFVILVFLLRISPTSRSSNCFISRRSAIHRWQCAPLQGLRCSREFTTTIAVCGPLAPTLGSPCRPAWGHHRRSLHFRRCDLARIHVLVDTVKYAVFRVAHV